MNEKISGQTSSPRCRGRARGLVVLGAFLAASVALGQTVTVPLDKYDLLRAKAFPRPPGPVTPDVGVSFEQAELELAVGFEHARVKAVATLWVHAEGWHSVPLPGDLPLLGLRATTGEARIAEDDRGRRLEFRGAPGRHRVEFDSSVAVHSDRTATRPTASFVVTLPAAARVAGTLTAGEGVGEVTGDGAVRVEPTGPRSWRFTGWPGEVAGFTLAGAPVAATAEGPLRFEVTTSTALALHRTRRQADAWLAGEVTGGRLERLAMPAPAGFEIVSVDGLEGLGWDVREGRLEITFAGAAPKSWRIHAALAADEAETSEVPLLLPAGARRTFVVTKAEARGGGLLERADGGGGRPAEPNELDRLPPEFRARLGEPLVVATGAPAPRWRVAWPADTEVLGAQVDRLLVDVLVGEHGRAFYQVWAVVRANGAPDLDFHLPGAARLVASRRDGTPARLGLRHGAWVAPLVSRDSEQILFWSAEIDLSWPRGGGRLEIPMPALSSPISTIEVRAGLPGGFRYEWLDPSRRGVIGGPPAAAAEKAGANELGRQFMANTIQKFVPAGESGGFQPLPGGFQHLEATWSTLGTAPSPLVLTVRSIEEARR